jgi:acyl carrier protein
MSTNEQVLVTLTSIFREVLDDDEIELTSKTTAQDIDGWDSLNHVRLMLTVQKHFGLKFSAAEIGRMKQVGDLVALIQGRSR